MIKSFLKIEKDLPVIKICAIFLVLVLAACVGNHIGDTTSGPSATPTPKASPSPSPSTTPTPTPTPSLPPCVAQTQPFTCVVGAPTLGPILQAIQSTVAWDTEGLYVQKLVEAINKDPRVCAQSGGNLPSDEISVKLRSSNAQSENYDVYNASGEPQLIPAGPTTANGPANICRPSRF